MALHNNIGKLGEVAVAEQLRAEGFTVIATNWRMNLLEIDIIATKGDTIAFVEVKTRTVNGMDPLDGMTARKVSLLCRAAETFIKINRIALNPRFDVAAVTVADDHDQAPQITYYPDAFTPPLRSY